MDLARHAARELLERTNLDRAAVDEVDLRAGRRVAARAERRARSEPPAAVPQEIPAYSLNRACASSDQAITAAHDQIALGHADVILAGGVESLSDIPILTRGGWPTSWSRPARPGRSGARDRAPSREIRPRDLIPVAPAIAEPSTGESMGQSAEKMAKENHITREAQDRWALRSHQLAARAPPTGG